MTRLNFISATLRVLSVAILALPTFAQSNSGDLVGTVTDSSGAAVATASVEALNVSTGIRTNATANETGLYRIPNLQAGTYRVTASAPGFTSGTLDKVQVDVNKVATVNLTLQVGQVTTTVDVREAPAVIDTTTATVGSTFDAAAARDLPVTSIGLGSANLALLNAGVASNGGLGVGEGPSVGGQRPYNNNFMVEGVDNNNKSVTGSLLRFIPNDAVAEFTVQQNQYSSEYGHSSGGQFNTVIRSGGNQIHGTVYEYMQNKTLNAIDQQVQNAAIQTGQRPENTRFDSNRFGASVGGPIKHNKWFYFGDFEYNPVGQAATSSAISAPTAEGYNILSQIPGLSQTNLGILKQYVPAATTASGEPITVAGQSIPVGTPPLSAPNYQNNYAAVASSDYNISDNDALRGRFLYNKLSTVDTTAQIPTFYTLDVGTYYIATLTEFHNFSPNVINELRLGYNRLNQTFPAGNFSYPGLDSFPNITLFDLGLDIGPNDQAPQFGIQNTYQISDNLTWNWHNHAFKWGFEGRKFIAPSSFTQRSRGDYEYNNLEVFLRDLQPDSFSERGLGNVVYYGDQIATYAYFNDSWRARQNLTINLGVRYEFTSVPYGERLQTLNHISDVPGVLVFNKPQPQYLNFAPRIGIAYSPGGSGKTSIRAGFGMAYDVLYDNIGILSLPPQLGTTVDDVNNGFPLDGRPNFLANGGILPNATAAALTADEARAATSGYVPDQKLPYSINWNFGVQHVFFNDYTLEARYLGSRGVHLDVQQRINRQAGVTPNQSLPTFLQAPSQATVDSLPLSLADLQGAGSYVPAFANAGFNGANIVVNSPIGNSTYNGLAVQLNRRFNNGLQFVGAYTWSHLIDDSTADFFTTLLTPRRPQDFQDLRADRSSSALDRRHRFTFTAIYETPWFKNSNWFMKNLVGNWSIAPIYTYESPEYVTVQSAIDSNLNGDSFGDRVVVNPAGQAGVGSDVTPLCRGGACNPDADNFASTVVGYVANNPNARYIVAGLGVYPNGGRNLLPGRPINNWDLNLLKSFSVTERAKFQLSAQFFNLVNHPQFIPGFTNRADNPAVLNVGAGVRNYLTPGNAIFNNPEAVYSSSPRGIQIAAKVIF
jgi:hypothetical protein